MSNKKNKKTEDEINAELEAKGRKAEADFDESQTLFVPAKKKDSQLISIRLPIAMLNELRNAAIQRGDIGYQQVIKWFIAEGLSKLKSDTMQDYEIGRRLKASGWIEDLLGNSFSSSPANQLPVSGVYSMQGRKSRYDFKMTGIEGEN